MKKLILLAALVAGMVNFASAQQLYAPATLALSCNAVTTTGPCTSMALPGNSLAIGVTWQLSYDTGTASGISVTLRGSNDNSTWTVLDTNTACVTTGGVTTGGAGCSRSLTVTAYKYLDCNVGTFTKGSTNNLSCGITVNPNGGTALGISGTITPGDCASWFNGTTLQDAGACGGGSGNANYTGTLNTVPCGTGTAHTLSDCTAGALIGAATGGVQGAGTVNVSSGYYVNGVAVVTSTVHSINFQMGVPGGAALSTGVMGYVTIPIGCTLTGWNIEADAGTDTVKTLKVAAGTAIPTLGSNSISTSGVSLAAGTVIQSTTLTDFTTTTFTANDIVGADLITTSGTGYIDFQLVMSCVH
jgi:hypothetical protein